MFFVGLVRMYRATISPDHGVLRHLYPYGYCRHDPTCSSYAIEMLKTEPLYKALWHILHRTASCHPWAKTDDARLREAVRRSLS